MFAMCVCCVLACCESEAEPVNEGDPEGPNNPEFDAEDNYASEGKSHRSLLDHIAPIVMIYPYNF
jgi:hypothetical protein